jgi:hypothetical protein
MAQRDWVMRRVGDLLTCMNRSRQVKKKLFQMLFLQGKNIFFFYSGYCKIHSGIQSYPLAGIFYLKIVD